MSEASRIARLARTTESRRAAQQGRALDRAMIQESARARRPGFIVTGEEIASAVEFLARAADRPMGTGRVGQHRGLSVIQRCRACCAELATPVNALDASWLVDLGHRVRHDYDSHRCAAVEVAMHACTPDELCNMEYDCEREMLRVGERLQAIRKAFEAALARETT